MSTNILATIVVILLVIAIILIARVFMDRAIRSVIRMFREIGATSASNARSIDELGLRQRPRFERLLRAKDYKPYALGILMNAGIVKANEDGNLYLSEEQLMRSRWGN
jgi:hypothetical protein